MVSRFQGSLSNINGLADRGEVQANVRLVVKSPEMYAFIEKVAQIQADTPLGAEALALLESCRA